MRDLLNKTQFRAWLALVGSCTVLLVAAYTLTQQSTRLSANDLPLATAQTIKNELETGSNPTDVVSSVKTNLKTDSTVFAIITDNTQHVLATSATLNDETPLPPSGVFSYSLTHGSDHFTWQPQAGVRLATEVLTYKDSPSDGFIITGQSLSEAENRIGTYGWIALGAWVAVVAWSTVTLLLPLKPNS
jgi:predicted component of type VI protein secretion system